jgi:hypothetical protein
MPTDDYEGLTPETARALSDCVIKELCDEWGVTPQYVHGILSGQKKDFFARFKRIFRHIARVYPVGAHGYIDTLESIYRAVVPAHRIPRINYGTDVVEEQVQIELNKTGLALAKKDSQLILRRSRALRAVLDALERKYMLEGREDSVLEKVS